MKADPDYSSFEFAPVMNYPMDQGKLYVFDFSKGYDPAFVNKQKEWGIGRYNEKRPDMYVAPQYENRRNIHMGIDIWAEAGEPVFSFYEGIVAYKQDLDEEGNYGPVIVTKHVLGEVHLYALFGHLSRSSLRNIHEGQRLQQKERIGELGDRSVNGGWEPHLHFQLSYKDPGEADMPGVVAEDEHETALQIYPDPRVVLGDLY